jgi:hypothetical protein
VLLIGGDIAINTVFYQMFGYASGITVIPSVYIALNKLYGVHDYSLPRLIIVILCCVSTQSVVRMAKTISLPVSERQYGVTISSIKRIIAASGLLKISVLTGRLQITSQYSAGIR